MVLIDPALMQIIQLLVYAIIGFLGVLGTYFTVKTNLLTKKTKDDLADNTKITENINTIVNGRMEKLMAENEELKKNLELAQKGRLTKK